MEIPVEVKKEIPVTMSIRVRFTRNGDDVPGRPQDPGVGVEGIHFDFNPGKTAPEFWYTRNKEIIGGKHAAPEGAVDIGLEWGTDDDGHLRMTTNWMNNKHETIGGSKGYTKSPDGADNWHLDLHGGVIKAAEWTHDGGQSYTPKSSLEVPNDADDAHVVLTVARGTPHPVSVGVHGYLASTKGRVVVVAGATTVEVREDLDAPGQPCGVVFTTTGEGNGTDSDAALNAAYTKAAVAAGLICARNTNGCDATEFVQYQKVSFGGTKGAVTCSIEAHFKCVRGVLV